MRSLRRPALVLTAAAIALFAVALALAARLTTRPPASAAPRATIFPTISPPAAPTASPTPVQTATPTPAPTSTTAPSPTPAPTDTSTPPTPTPELIMLVPPSPAPALNSRQAIVNRPPAASCPNTGAAFATLDSLGAYKNNRLSDANPDLRLSLLGYAEVPETPALIDYDGATDPAAPRLAGLLASNRAGAIVRTFRRFDWLWDEGSPPPYGARGGLNNDWPATVIALAARPGEFVYTPPRPADIGGGFVALVLFAADDELTLAYHRQDGVADGYVIHLRGLCVDPNLVALYRAQLTDGRRTSGRLPALTTGQPLGSALASGLIVAVRDRGAFMDPRSRKDWW